MSIAFSLAVQQQIQALCQRYPNQQAACLPVLHLAQAEFGYLSDEVLRLVATTLGLSVAHVEGVASFYTMFRRKPCGKYVLMMCTNVSCMLKGGQETLAALEEKLGIRAGETTPDGLFTLVEEECLAACAGAPAMVCGEEYHLQFTADRVDAVLQACRNHPHGPGKGDA